MNYTKEALEEEQMSNLGCESVADLIQSKKDEQEKPYEIQIWFHAQEDNRYLGIPHVVIPHHNKDDAFAQFESIRMFSPFHIQLMEYTDGDGDTLDEDGTWGMEE